MRNYRFWVIVKHGKRREYCKKLHIDREEILMKLELICQLDHKICYRLMLKVDLIMMLGVFKDLKIFCFNQLKVLPISNLPQIILNILVLMDLDHL